MIKKKIVNDMENNALRVRKSREIKLKARGERRYIPITFMRDFGFMPESIIIERVQGCNNKIVVMAVLTPEEAKKEDEMLKKNLEPVEEVEKQLDQLNKAENALKEQVIKEIAK